MSDRKIFIRATDDGFAVTVEPVLDGADLDQAFGSHKEAFGYACGIRMTRGWPVVYLGAGYGQDLLGIEGGAA